MRPDDALILDIILACRRLLRFCDGVDWKSFQNDEILQHAVLRPLEVIGEAASRISEATRQQHPDLPWQDMSGMRNRLIHEYFAIRIEVVWDTIQQDIPTLLAQLEDFQPPPEPASTS